MIDLLAVHQALCEALTADDAVAEGRVYDFARANVEFPYIEIAESVDVADDTSGTGDGLTPSDGIEHIVTLRAWSRGHRGQKELFEIAGQVRSVLHRADLEVDGLASCICFVEGATYIKDPDGVTHQASIRVQMICRT